MVPTTTKIRRQTPMMISVLTLALTASGEDIPNTCEIHAHPYRRESCHEPSQRTCERPGQWLH
jgi:hypothetical protein